MSDNFLNSVETENGEYTNVVTADDLNNIARDLGLADYSHFPEEPPESAVSALNQITKDLTSKGILHIGNECAVSISGCIISVADGVCVFETGAKKRINAEDVVTVEFIPGGTNYVYMEHNEADNQVQLISSLEEPTEGDFVMLAEIDTEQNVLDHRFWSVSKVSNGINKCLHIKQEMTFSKTYESRLSYTYDLDGIGGNFIIMPWYDEDEDKLRAYPLEESKKVDITFESAFWEYMEIRKEGSVLYVEPYQNNEKSISTNEVEIWVL